MTRRNKEKILNTLTYAALLIIIFVVNLPNIYMAGTAFKTKNAALTELSLLPKKISIENFYNVFQNTTYGRNVVNSIVVSLTVTLVCIIIASFAGYAVSRFRNKFFGTYSIMLLILQMFPAVLILIPLFTIYKKIGLINTPYSVILSYTALFLPFSTWMLKGFFDTIPFEIEESAMIDGCSQFASFCRVIVPLSLPGIATVAIFAFINCWNEYMLASIFLREDSIQTLTVGLQKFIQQFDSDWAALMAASTIATIPTIFFLIFAQKYIVQGLTAGAVKG